MEKLKLMVENVMKTHAYRTPCTSGLGGDTKTMMSVQDLITEAEKIEGDVQDDEKAEFYLLLGRTCNSCESPPSETEGYLMKAAKLSKSSVDAWNELGEYYWNKGEVQSAKTIFLGALEKQRNSVSLRNMSTIYRHIAPSSNPDYMENLNQSLKLAKEAISLDMKDGKSWSTLGNAYFSLYACIQDPINLKNCLNAYKQAEKDLNCSEDPDFCLNYGNILRVCDLYQEAFDSYQAAETLSPNWKLAEGKSESLFRSLKVVEENVAAKGKLKPKKIQSIISTINFQEDGGSLQHGYVAVGFQSLEPGVNPMKVLHGCIVADIPMDKGVPRCLVLIQTTSQAFAVSIYNVAQELPLKIGDRLVIVDPEFKEVKVVRGKQSATFPSVRVDDPRKILLNGRPIMKQYVVACQVRSMRPDPAHVAGK